MTADPTPRRHSRGRRYMTGLVVVLACISLLASVLVTWAHQSILNTDRYVRIVSEVQQDPAVQTEMAAFISKQVVDALGVQARVADALPAKAGFLAVPVAAAVERTLDEQLAKVVASPQFATVWEEGNRLVHEQLVRALRGDTTVLTVNNGMVTFNLYPLVGKALTALQEQGFIPAGVTLPEFSGTRGPGRDPDEAADRTRDHPPGGLRPDAPLPGRPAGQPPGGGPGVRHPDRGRLDRHGHLRLPGPLAGRRAAADGRLSRHRHGHHVPRSRG